METVIIRNGLHDWWFEIDGFRYHFPSKEEAEIALDSMTKERENALQG